jgi:hypothetical protein
MKKLVAMMIWLLDLILKFAVGYLVVSAIWAPFGFVGDIPFSVGWLVAGGVLGACISGFLGGCDLILLGWAKRILDDT